MCVIAFHSTGDGADTSLSSVSRLRETEPFVHQAAIPMSARAASAPPRREPPAITVSSQQPLHDTIRRTRGFSVGRFAARAAFRLSPQACLLRTSDHPVGGLQAGEHGLKCTLGQNAEEAKSSAMLRRIVHVAWRTGALHLTAHPHRLGVHGNLPHTITIQV